MNYSAFKWLVFVSKNVGIKPFENACHHNIKKEKVNWNIPVLNA